MTNNPDRCQDCAELPDECKCAEGGTETTVWSATEPDDDVDEPECSETDHDHRGDCDGDLHDYIAVRSGEVPNGTRHHAAREGETVTLCGGHARFHGRHIRRVVPPTTLPYGVRTPYNRTPAVVGRIEQSVTGNTVLHIGRMTDPLDRTPGNAPGMWTKIAHLVLTADERIALIATLQQHEDDPAATSTAPARSSFDPELAGRLAAGQGYNSS